MIYLTGLLAMIKKFVNDYYCFVLPVNVYTVIIWSILWHIHVGKPLAFFTLCLLWLVGMDQVAGGGWDHVLAAMQIPDLNIEDFLQTALDEGTFLLLYGYIVQKLPLCQQLLEEQALIGRLLNWITVAKPL